MMEYIDKYVWYQEGPGVRKLQYTSEGIKLLNVANLVDGKIDLSTSHRYISKKEAQTKYKHFLVDEGDLIIASSGIQVDYFDKKMGFAQKEHLPLCMNTSTIRFKVLNPKVTNIKYFMWFLKSSLFKMQLSRLITGSAQLNFGPSHLKKIKIDMPIKSEQDNIVNKLDKVQEIIDLRKKQIEELDELIKSKFVETFGDISTNSKNYKIVKLSDISKYWNGLTYKPSDINENGTIVLRSSNIQNGKLDYKDLIRVSCIIPEKKYVKNNDILMCSRNGSARLVGKVALITNSNEDMSFGAFMMIIRSKYYLYLMTFFQMDSFRAQISTGVTTTINQITSNMMNNVKLPLPSMDEINKFAKIVEQINKQKFMLEKSLKETEELQESLMSKYFGE